MSSILFGSSGRPGQTPVVLGMTLGLRPYRGTPKPDVRPFEATDGRPPGTVETWGLCGAAVHPAPTNFAGVEAAAGTVPPAQPGGTDIPPTAGAWLMLASTGAPPPAGAAAGTGASASAPAVGTSPARTTL